MTLNTDTRDCIGTAIERMRSLHEGDLGLVDVIGCGRAAIPHLRTVLFEREPSGLFETRCRAVQALAALKAYNVLIDFLATPHEMADPVERLGDDAVINAAARAVTRFKKPEVFSLLIKLAKKRLWPGVIAALGTFRRKETIPYLTAALAEDECRFAAEAGLIKLGAAGRDALIEIVSRAPSPRGDSPSEIRQRQSAWSLLVRIANSPAARSDALTQQRKSSRGRDST
jgi:hypothetical protein